MCKWTIRHELAVPFCGMGTNAILEYTKSRRANRSQEVAYPAYCIRRMILEKCIQSAVYILESEQKKKTQK